MMLYFGGLPDPLGMPLILFAILTFSAYVGFHREPSRRAMVVLALLEADGAAPRAPAAIADSLGVSPPEIERLLGELVDAGVAVRLGPGVYFARVQGQGIAGTRKLLVVH